MESESKTENDLKDTRGAKKSSNIHNKFIDTSQNIDKKPLNSINYNLFNHHYFHITLIYVMLYLIWRYIVNTHNVLLPPITILKKVQAEFVRKFNLKWGVLLCIL